MLPPDQIALVIAGAAGILASAAVEVVNRTTGKKLPGSILQALGLAIAVALVVGFALLQGGGVVADWKTVSGQLALAWFAALGLHDVASPRKKDAQEHDSAAS